MITLSLDIKAIDQGIEHLTQQIQLVYCLDVVSTGARHFLARYISLMSSLMTEPGSKSFLHAYQGIGYKTSVFKDNTGAYAVIGGTVGSKNRMRSPQLRFGEFGTKERWTKAGDYRGIMPAFNWLHGIITANEAEGQRIMQERLRTLVASQ